jgi:hypothetical protein
MDKTYICEFCGKKYDRPFERAQCEVACYNRIQIEEEKAAQARREQKKKDSYNEIVTKLDEVDKLIVAYTKEYGHLTLKLPTTLRGFDDDFGTVPNLWKTWF